MVSNFPAFFLSTLRAGVKSSSTSTLCSPSSLLENNVCLMNRKLFCSNFYISPLALSRSLPNGEFSPPTTGHLPQSSQVSPQQPNNTSSKRIFTSQRKKKSNEAWKEIFSDTRSQSLRFWKTAEADVVVNEACLCLLFLTFDQFSSCHFAHWLLVISSLA